MDEWIDGEWIRQNLQRSRVTQRELARRVGMDPSVVSRLLDGKRKLQMDEARKIRAFFDAPTSAGGRAPEDATKRAGEIDPRRRPPGPRPRHRFSADIPIYNLHDGKWPYFALENGQAAEYRPCPPSLVGVAGGFGVFVPGDGLAPRIRAGEVVYVHPSKPPTAGSDVFVRMRKPEGGVAILRFLKRDGDVVRFDHVADPRWERDRPRDALRIGWDEIGQIGRIVLISTE